MNIVLGILTLLISLLILATDHRSTVGQVVHTVLGLLLFIFSIALFQGLNFAAFFH